MGNNSDGFIKGTNKHGNPIVHVDIKDTLSWGNDKGDANRELAMPDLDADMKRTVVGPANGLQDNFNKSVAGTAVQFDAFNTAGFALIDKAKHITVTNQYPTRQVTFDVDSTKLKPEDKATIAATVEEDAKIFKNDPNSKIYITGHASPTGYDYITNDPKLSDQEKQEKLKVAKQHNMDLSIGRTNQSAEEYVRLMHQNHPEYDNRIVIVQAAKGDNDPTNKNVNEVAENRNVTFQVSSTSTTVPTHRVYGVHHITDNVIDKDRDIYTDLSIQTSSGARVADRQNIKQHSLGSTTSKNIPDGNGGFIHQTTTESPETLVAATSRDIWDVKDTNRKRADGSNIFPVKISAYVDSGATADNYMFEVADPNAKVNYEKKGNTVYVSINGQAVANINYVTKDGSALEADKVLIHRAGDDVNTFIKPQKAESLSSAELASIPPDVMKAFNMISGDDRKVGPEDAGVKKLLKMRELMTLADSNHSGNLDDIEVRKMNGAVQRGYIDTPDPNDKTGTKYKRIDLKEYQTIAGDIEATGTGAFSKAIDKYLHGDSNSDGVNAKDFREILNTDKAAQDLLAKVDNMKAQGHTLTIADLRSQLPVGDVNKNTGPSNGRQ